MSESLFGMPPATVEAEIAAGRVALTVDTNLHPLDAIYAAAYAFIARCYVLLERPAPERVRVVLAPKPTGADAEALRALVGEFANELLSSTWRREITRSNRALIEAVTTQAFAGALGPPSLDDLEAFQFGDEPFEDPLGIAQSWEEKYRKKAKPEEPTE